MLAALRRPTGNAPKKLPAFLMYSSENAAMITATCLDKANIAERNRKGKELFDAEPQEVRDRYEEAVKKKYEEDMAKYTDALSGLPSVNPEDRSK